MMRCYVRGGISVMLMCCVLLSVAYADSVRLVHASSTLLSDEQLVGISCLPNAGGVEHLLVCLDNFNSRELPLVDWSDGCHMSFIDLSGFSCNRVALQVLFNRDGLQHKLSETFSITKVQVIPQRIIETQEWDGGWSTPSDTAYSIWILSQYENLYREKINQGLAWLKEHRNEHFKCWSIDMQTRECSMYETARTLAFLRLAGIDETVRIYNDARSWLEMQQNYLFDALDTEWTVQVRPSSDAMCRVRLGEQTVSEQEINASVVWEVEIRPLHQTLINVTCDDTSAQVSIIDGEGNSIGAFSDATNQTGRRWMIPAPCWSANGRWRSCDIQVTMYALAVDIRANQWSAAKEWLDDQLERHPVVGRFLPTYQRHFDAAFYLHAVDGDNTPVLDWLVYSQNNDGSWGSSTPRSQIAPTAMSILGLSDKIFDTSQEVLRDARQWVSLHTPFQGWDSVKDDALAFMILKENARALLRIDQQLPVQISGKQQIVVHNPTSIPITDALVEFDEQLQEILDIEMPSDIDAHSNVTLSINPQKTTAGVYRGQINISHEHGVLLYIPIEYEQDIVISMEFPQVAHVFDNATTLEITVSAVNADFECRIDWDIPGITSNSFSVTTPGTVRVPVVVDLIDSVDVSPTIVCRYGEFSYIATHDFTFQIHHTVPLLIRENRVRITQSGRNATVTITNQIDDRIHVSVDIPNNMYAFGISPRMVTLDPFESQQIVIVNPLYPEDNVTMETVIRFSVLGVDQEIPFIVDVRDRSGLRSLIFYIIILFVLVSGIGAGGYYGYRYRRSIVKTSVVWYADIKQYLPRSIAKHLPLTAEEKLARDERKSEGKHERDYFEEIVAIMKSLEKSDEDIRKRLLAEGLTDNQVDTVLDAYAQTEKIKQTIKHEEDVLHLIHNIGDESNEIFKKLKDQGYSESELKEAVSELSKDIEEKEKQIKREAGLLEEEEVIDEVSYGSMDQTGKKQ